VAIAAAERLRVDGFADDTLVAGVLERLAEAAGVEPRWAARLWKRIPVASGLGGGSSDAATALRLANATLPAPLPPGRLAEVAAAVGSDVPFFLTAGPQLGEANGTRLSPLDLPQDYWVVLLLPRGESKPSTASVYEAFDRRGGADGYEARREELLAALGGVRRPRDLAALPPNDLASSPHADRLRELGAFRADVTGAGPTVYGLFLHEAGATAARKAIRGLGKAWITVPAWYG
jgi:4-diphosphocytidyl-2-C-methyl-D-erythritol kinase